MRYARACTSHENFIARGMWLPLKIYTGIGWVRHWRRLIFNKVILFTSSEYEIAFLSMIIYSGSLHRSKFTPTHDHVTEFDIFTKYDLSTQLRKVFYRAYGCEMLVDRSNSSGYLFVPIWDLYIFKCWDQSFQEESHPSANVNKARHLLK